MNKILYFSHVPWNWIKQRPQFIAEELSQHYQVDIFQEKAYVSNLVSGSVSKLKIITLFRLPLNRISIIRRINAWLMKRQLRPKIAEYDYLWFTSPTLYRSVQNIIPRKIKVIYDCMDDILAFPAIQSDPVWKKEMRKAEKEMIGRANAVFCTSEHLKEKLMARYGSESDEITVINNALNIYNNIHAETLPDEIATAFDSGIKNLTYIGTVSAWFDFETALQALNMYPDLHLYLFGPTEVDIPRHERITHFGPIRHEQVYAVMEKAGALIMPFKLNDLILSVNPVKLYEYIYCGKITIVRKYGETSVFGDYVYLYDNASEFISLVDKYMRNELTLKQTPETCHQFGMDNSWEKRVDKIREKLPQVTFANPDNIRISSNTIVLNEKSYIDGLVQNLLDANMDEIVFLDGGSTDGTYELLLEYERKYPNRIVAIRWKQPDNSVFGDAFRESVRRNVQKDASTGDYILIIDADERINLDFKQHITLSPASIATPWLQFWGDKIRVNTADDAVWYPGYRVRFMRNVPELRFQQYSNLGIHYNFAQRGHRLIFGFTRSSMWQKLFAAYNRLWGFSYVINEKIIIYHLHYQNLNLFKINDLRKDEKDFEIIAVNNPAEGLAYRLDNQQICCLNSEIQPELKTFMEKYRRN
ncbi:MAG: glycosyltransferase family 2 protein [Bacteroidales bacterium]|jgi:glycosyltransferase involved in cell wall biosynthesis|nr:glycosyltransferase family 2 protein [Bacteroidales bacterium]